MAERRALVVDASAIGRWFIKNPPNLDKMDGVEPTNNAAERAIRPAVLWRKGCFGADSPDGNTFVAKILTASATCRQQQRDLLVYLADIVVAHRVGRTPPPLFDST